MPSLVSILLASLLTCFRQGLLSHLPRKNAEDIATLVDVERLVLQAFIGTAPWDDRPLITVLVEQAVDQLAAGQLSLGGGDAMPAEYARSATT